LSGPASWPGGATARRFHGWNLVAAVFVILTVCSGLTVYSLSVFLHAFVAEGRFTIDQVSFASGMYSASGALVGLLVSRLLERHDVRRVMTAGVLLMAGALLALPWVHGLPALFAFYIVLGIGYGGAALIPCTTLVTRWFTDRRSSAMSFAATGNSFGAIVLVPPVAMLVGATGIGGAGPWLALAMMLGVLPLTWLVLRSWPSDLGLAPLGESPGAAAAASVVPDAQAMARATRSRYYRWSSLAFLLGMAAHVGGQTHLYNLLRQRDLDTDAAALAIALLAAASVLARFPAVWAMRRITIRQFLGLLLVVQGLALPLIGADAPAWVLLAGVMAFGATIGNFITTHSLLLAQAFGVAAYPRLYGLARVISVAGVLCGPGLMGVLYKHQHGYAGAFMAAGLVSLLGGLALAAAGRDPQPGDSS
jgi:sugar phosphate permease